MKTKKKSLSKNPSPMKKKRGRPAKNKIINPPKAEESNNKMTPEQQQSIVDFLTPIQAVTGGSFSVTFTPSEVPVVPTPVTFTVPPAV
jgi:hypothetical protein